MGPETDFVVSYKIGYDQNQNRPRAANAARRVTPSTPRLPFQIPHNPTNGDHRALDRGALEGLGRKDAWGPKYIKRTYLGYLEPYGSWAPTILLGCSVALVSLCSFLLRSPILNRMGLNVLTKDPPPLAFGFTRHMDSIPHCCTVP